MYDMLTHDTLSPRQSILTYSRFSRIMLHKHWVSRRPIPAQWFCLNLLNHCFQYGSRNESRFTPVLLFSKDRGAHILKEKFSHLATDRERMSCSGWMCENIRRRIHATSQSTWKGENRDDKGLLICQLFSLSR